MKEEILSQVTQIASAELDPDCKFILSFLHEDLVVLNIFSLSWEQLLCAKHPPGAATLFPIERASISNGGY